MSANAAPIEPAKPPKDPFAAFAGDRPDPFSDSVRVHPGALLDHAHLTQELAEKLHAQTHSWLRELLGDGWMPVSNVMSQAVKDGVIWSITEAVAAEYVIEEENLFGRYWKVPKPPNWRSRP